MAAKSIKKQTAESPSLTETDEGRREHFATIKQRFTVDEGAIKAMSSQFDGLAKALGSVNEQLDAIISKGKTGMDALGGIAGASGSGAGGAPIAGSQVKTKAGTTGTTGAALSSGIWDKMKQRTAEVRKPMTEAWGGGGKGAVGGYMGKMGRGFGKWMVTGAGGLGGGSAQMPVVQATLGAMNWTRNRYQGASDYMLTSDRTGMLMRQMYGGTQLQYQRRYRQPMTNALIGNEGIEQMLNLQLTTGLGRTREQQQSMLSGVEGIRVASGFGYSTEQATQMISAMAQPGSSNMMTMMLGMGMYGPGGKQNDPMDVIRNTVRRMGLTNESMVQGAFQPGSMTRANLARTGLPVDMQNLVLQYAQENIEFQKAGGEGMYDPSKKEHRQRMGVEEGYATEFERTRREETRRQEDFYRRQIDNYEQVEENTQAMIKLTAAIEDKFSSLIGTQMNVAQHPLTRIGLPIIGGLLGLAVTAGNPAGLMAGISGGMAAANAIGDEDDPSSSKVTPIKFIDKGRGTGWNALVGDGTGIGIQAMANAAASEAGHKLTLTSGTRTDAEQRDLFEARHKLVIPGHDPSAVNGRRRSDGLRYADGTGGVVAGWYRLNDVGIRKGLAMPPGASKHQTGEAADLGPKSAEDWIAANAGRFGLKNPINAQGAVEKWHVSLSGSGAQQTISAEATAAAASAEAPAAVDSAEATAAATSSVASQFYAYKVGVEGVTDTSASYAPSVIAPVALPQGVSKASAPAVSSGTQRSPVSASVATTSGNTITIAPSITLAGTGSDAVDAQNLANKVIKIIETSDAVQALRTS